MQGKKWSLKKKILLAVLIVVLACLLVLGIAVLVLTLTEYKPEATETVKVKGTATKTLEEGDSITVVSWNIGYGALGDNADFFMDGGSSVMTADKDRVKENLTGIAKELVSLNPDVVFMQEVDLNSKRSHFIDEKKSLTSALPDYANSFATNYKVLYIPYPIPFMGQVDCGILSLSKYKVDEAERISLPCPFSYPYRLCNLKRCLLVNRVSIKGSDKELVLVNLHLEAYDNGEGKAAQTKQLYEFLQEEVDAGNYVIAGGDFNQIFSNVDSSDYPLVSEDMWEPGVIDVDEFGSDFTLMMDDSEPSCRSLDQAYEGADLDNFQYYIIDGFIVSNNLTVDDMETINLDFENSDHNPVKLQVTLN